MKTGKALLGALASLALAAALQGADVLVSVGSQKIDSVEFEAKAALEERKAGHKLNADERKAVLQSLVNQRLLVAKAEEDGFAKKDEFRRALEDARMQLLAGMVYDSEIGSKAQVSETEAKAFYGGHPELFDVREISQILVQPKAADEASVRSAKKKAEELKAKAEAAPKAFAKLAKASSDDPNSKEHGGDLGMLRRGMLVPELEKAVFEAKPGTILGPLKTQFGFHVLQVRSAHHQNYDEAKEAISHDLGRAKAAQLQQTLLEGLSKKTKVTFAKDKP